jgi:hypothetical protein
VLALGLLYFDLLSRSGGWLWLVSIFAAVAAVAMIEYRPRQRDAAARDLHDRLPDPLKHLAGGFWFCQFRFCHWLIVPIARHPSWFICERSGPIGSCILPWQW